MLGEDLKILAAQLVLHEVLGLQLSIFSRQFKMKSGINDNHRVIVRMPKEMWFRGMENKEVGEKRQSAKETKAHLEAMLLRTKPEPSKWLYFTPRKAALGMDTFKRGPAMITKSHSYLSESVELSGKCRRKIGRNRRQDRLNNTRGILDTECEGRRRFKRTDSKLEGLGARWIASFLAKVYSPLSCYLIREFLEVVTEFSIVAIVGLFVTFEVKRFVKGR